MNESWQIRIYEQQQLVCTIDLTGPAELGRQRTDEESLYSHQFVSGRRRVVIAPKDETTVSRQHALLEPLAEGGFRLSNLSAERTIDLEDGSNIKPKSVCTVPQNALLTLGTRTVRLQRSVGPVLPLRGLAEPTLPPGQSSFGPIPLGAATTIEMTSLVPWLHAAMDVLQSAASSADFFVRAARAVVELVNLDSASVLLFKQGDWQSQGFHAIPALSREPRRPVSHRVLEKMREEKRTFWQVPELSLPATASLEEVDAVVAAPILDRNGTVIGALYGDRRRRGASSSGEPILEVEAMFVQLLARGVAAGLARLEQEQAALAARVQFEQFFTPELSHQLARHPNLLQGRDTEVSVIFCDIRAFSRISERLGPAKTVEWINDVLSALSECVRAEEGVLVDYVGDELMAMWGAPDEQPDHAARACRAALAMLNCLPALNERWQTTLKEPLDLGLGVNTGLARVGNVGSQQKFKYGPLGNTVNLASRVQGATKYLKCRVLITGATRAKLDSSFATRRLCSVRVVNIAEPVALHELVPRNQPHWPAAQIEYEKALLEFEKQNFSKAASILGNWRVEHPEDAPPLLLLYRVVQCMVEEPGEFDPIWSLPGK